MVQKSIPIEHVRPLMRIMGRTVGSLVSEERTVTLHFTDGSAFAADVGYPVEVFYGDPVVSVAPDPLALLEARVAALEQRAQWLTAPVDTSASWGTWTTLVGGAGGGGGAAGAVTIHPSESVLTAKGAASIGSPEAVRDANRGGPTAESERAAIVAWLLDLAEGYEAVLQTAAHDIEDGAHHTDPKVVTCTFPKDHAHTCGILIDINGPPYELCGKPLPVGKPVAEEPDPNAIGGWSYAHGTKCREFLHRPHPPRAPLSAAWRWQVNCPDCGLPPVQGDPTNCYCDVFAALDKARADRDAARENALVLYEALRIAKERIAELESERDELRRALTLALSAKDAAVACFTIAGESVERLQARIAELEARPTVLVAHTISGTVKM